MPMSASKEELQNSTVMWFREKPIKNGDSTLIIPRQKRNDTHWPKWRTWRRSSKSRAAIFFISDEFAANFLMTSRPNVGTCRYLMFERQLCVLRSNRHSNAHRRSMSLIKAASAASRMRIRWVYSAFQTPSSNSCMRSTVNIGNRSKASGPNRVEKAF
jgi:hypothetical protein